VDLLDQVGQHRVPDGALGRFDRLPDLLRPFGEMASLSPAGTGVALGLARVDSDRSTPYTVVMALVRSPEVTIPPGGVCWIAGRTHGEYRPS
jgi:hypothetical protein